MDENRKLPVEVGEQDMLPNLGDFPIDDGILAKFPPGTQVISANRYGLSQWTITARLHVKFPDGQTNRYFLKTAKGEVGRRLMEGEFHAISALHNVDNFFSPKPHSWGKRSGPGLETYFFLLQFIDMSDRSQIRISCVGDWLNCTETAFRQPENSGSISTRVRERLSSR